MDALNTRKTQTGTSSQYQTETVRMGICRRESVTSRQVSHRRIVDNYRQHDWCTQEKTGCLYPSAKIFGVLEIFDLTSESIRESSNRLVEAYPEDLEYDLADKLVQFCSFARSSRGIKQGDETVSFQLRLYRIASSPKVREAFPNINIALRIYLSRLVTNSIAQESGHFL